MNRILFLIISLIISCGGVKSQNRYHQSVLIGSSIDGGVGIYEIDAAGNAYVVIGGRGSIYLTNETVNRSSALDNAVIAKFSSTGVLMWSKTLNRNNGSIQIYDLKVDSDQNVYVSGAGSSITLDDNTVLKGGVFLVKINKNGLTEWGVSEDKDSGSSSNRVSGPIAIVNDGVYWSGSFSTEFNLQGYSLKNFNPNSGSNNSFIVKIKKDGKITSIYQDRGLINVLTPTKKNEVAVIPNRGGLSRVKFLLDANCKPSPEKPSISFSENLSRITKWKDGNEVLSYLYEQRSFGAENIGFYHCKFDDELNLTDTIKLFSEPINSGDRTIFNAINYNDEGYFLTSPLSRFIPERTDWMFLDEFKNLNILPSEPRGPFGNDAFRITFTKVVSDTLHILMRHNNGYVFKFNFDGKEYNKITNNDLVFFWVKYLYQDPDSCKKITVKVEHNGVEGSNDVEVKFYLPNGCPASSDILILTSSIDKTDFVLPPNVIIKRGETEATLKINVVDDNIIENLEEFKLDFVLDDNSLYKLKNKSLTFNIDDNDNIPANRFYTLFYTKEITEGQYGEVKVSLPNNLTAQYPINFNFLESPINFNATPIKDYSKFNITIPAGFNSVKFKVEAYLDQTLEGDEFINGNLLAAENVLGNFYLENSLIKIKIIDVDNVAQNREIIVTSEKNELPENGSLKFNFKNKFKSQYNVNVSTSQHNWVNYINQTLNSFVLDSTKDESFSVVYPEDEVIRIDRNLNIAPTASSSNIGLFKFVWNNKIVDTLNFNIIDNDKEYAVLNVSPINNLILEGDSAQLAIKISKNKTFDNDVFVNYNWVGLGINDDKRIEIKYAEFLLPKLNNEVILKLRTNDNELVDINNIYELKFKAQYLDPTVKFLKFDNTAFIEIIDNDINLKIPNTFTPNGDGVNDTWLIPNLTSDLNAKLEIYNKNGMIVYKANGLIKEWSGVNNKGEILPIGTYYYILNSWSKKYAGSVNLIR